MSADRRHRPSARKGVPVGKRAQRGEAMAYLLATLTTDPHGCTAWPYTRGPKGYGQVRVGGRLWPVHALVCTWYHGPRPEGQEVRHLCGNGHLGCFTPRHLAWGTAAENAADKRKEGP